MIFPVNGTPDRQPQAVAVDVGHGYVKALGASNQRVMFPSLICPQPPMLDLGDFGKAEVITIDDQPYLVGESARAHATPLWSKDKATDRDTLRLVLVAAAQLDAVGPVKLTTGLPLGWFGSQRKAFREALIGYSATVQLPKHSPQRLWIDSVKVLPQGVAAAVVALSNPAYPSGPFVVADVGYRTTEYLVVTKQPNGQLAYDATQAGSLEIGTHAITAKMSANLEREHRLSFKPAEIESTDTVFAYGHAVDLHPIRQQAANLVSAQLRDRLTEILDDRLLRAVGIILVGGGSMLLSSAFPGSVVMPDGQWANVSAYFSA